jgi:membrane protein
VTTALFWIGLGVFSSFYFSSTIISDNKLYGTVGVVFDLVTWFIAVGAVLMLGAVVGAVWEDRKSRSTSPEAEDPSKPTEASRSDSPGGSAVN